LVREFVVSVPWLRMWKALLLKIVGRLERQATDKEAADKGGYGEAEKH
jgi:hypothetical protein